MLADARLDRRFRRDGFVRTRVIEAGPASELLERFTEIRGTTGEGFEADLTNADQVYRRRVDGVLNDALATAVSSLFVDSVPFLWNFLCKWPNDPEDLYLHRDWMFIDERDGRRSCSVWIALQDIGPQNGMLRVLPGSHRLNNVLAGTGLDTEWLERSDVIERRLVDVPTRAGEAVVIDHALVHSSHRNASSSPRVAVGCGMRPSDLGLVHFRRTDDTAAVRYDVDPDFFVTNTPQSLMAAPPALTPAEAITVLPPGTGAGAPNLAADLDRVTSIRHRARRWGRRPTADLAR